MTMKKNAEWLSLVGFILVTLGISALALSFVGLRFSFLTWLDAPGRFFGFAVRVLMVVIGFLGYKISKAVTPKAPAPTDVKVTKKPSTKPKITVNAGT